MMIFQMIKKNEELPNHQTKEDHSDDQKNEDLSDYEKVRLKNIEEQKAKVMLSLKKKVMELSPTLKPKESPLTSRTPSNNFQKIEVQRRSTRLALKQNSDGINDSFKKTSKFREKIEVQRRSTRSAQKQNFDGVNDSLKKVIDISHSENGTLKPRPLKPSDDIFVSNSPNFKKTQKRMENQSNQKYIVDNNGIRKKVRRVRCNECQACLSADCRKCTFCKDMKKYGGPCTMKQTCKQRKCLNLKLPGEPKKSLKRQINQLNDPQVTMNLEVKLNYSSKGLYDYIIKHQPKVVLEKLEFMKSDQSPEMKFQSLELEDPSSEMEVQACDMKIPTQDTQSPELEVMEMEQQDLSNN